MAHLGEWLVATNRDGAALTDEVIEEYLRVRRVAGYRNHTTTRALAPLVAYLRVLRVVPGPADAPPATPMEALIAEFGDYLANERGLAPGSVYHHRRFARVFLTELGLTEAAGLDGLTAADVTSFGVSQAQRRSPGDMRTLVSALRSLLRFLHLTGRVAQPLAAAFRRCRDGVSGRFPEESKPGRSRQSWPRVTVTALWAAETTPF